MRVKNTSYNINLIHNYSYENQIILFVVSHNPIKIIEDEYTNYLSVIEQKVSENSKAQYFAAIILTKVFQVDPADIDWEIGVKTVRLAKRGRIDAVFGNVLFEFKKDLRTATDVAEEELHKYLQSYHEKNPGDNFIGIASDGVLFKVYKPRFSHTPTGERQAVEKIIPTDSLDLVEVKDSRDIFTWFDSYFFWSQKIIPTSYDIKKRFGLKSATYVQFFEELITLHESLKSKEFFNTKFKNWAKYLEIVYGDPVDEIDLFLRHTYLSTLVKMIVTVRLTGGKVFTQKDIPKILNGYFFTASGIDNFVEEDFFTWITHPDLENTVNKLVFKLGSEINNVYDLNKINEDVLKELYQELVDPVYRKELGEFYTPNWLAQLTVQELLNDNPKQKVLDPSCGSGTFLFSAIKYKIDKLKDDFPDDNDLLNHLLSSVSGFDIHPMAALISKTNYLLALGTLPINKKNRIEIPVYLSDSVKLPSEKASLFSNESIFEFKATDKHSFHIPTEKIGETTQTDEAINKISEIAKVYVGNKFKLANLSDQDLKEKMKVNRDNLTISFEKSIKTIISSDSIRNIWIENFQTIIKLIDEDKDSIWTYIMKNGYKPLFFSKNKIDVIMGNPPWITMQKMKNKNYQKFLKDNCFKYGLIDKKNAKQYAHMELATLFFCMVLDLYLSDEGKLGFVMPRSILKSTHHEKFMEFLNPQFCIDKILDAGDAKTGVTPLFKVPSCVIIGHKGEKNTYPVRVTKMKGKLHKIGRNENLSEVKNSISFEDDEFEPYVLNVDPSYYYDEFFQGATIVPRNFYFVEIYNNGLGIDPSVPTIRSNPKNDTKPPWTGITLKGQAHRNFLFGTILGENLVPYGTRSYNLIVLPIFLQGGHPTIISNYTDLQKQSFLHASEWFQKAEEAWNENRKAGSAKMTLYQRLGHFKGITRQDLNKKFKVLYSASSTFLTACVIEPSKPISFKFEEQEILLNGFIAESKTYYFETDDEDEALYLCGILNSKTVDDIIKPSQTGGLWGERDIHKRPLLLPIPLFSKSNPKHMKLAKISKACSEKVPNFLESITTKDIGNTRTTLRNSLKNEMMQIDSLTQKILIDTDPRIDSYIQEYSRKL